MARGGPTCRAKVELARICLGIGDQVGDRGNWQRRVDNHQIRPPHRERDRNQIAAHIVWRILFQRGVGGDHRGVEQKCVAVWGCTGDGLGANASGCARPVFNHHRLPQARTDIGGKQACRWVGRAAGRIGNDQLDGPIGEICVFLPWFMETRPQSSLTRISLGARLSAETSSTMAQSTRSPSVIGRVKKMS